MNALLNQINIMNTAIPFKHPFITDGSDVLDYITAIYQNVIVNPLLTAVQQYQLIIRQIPTELAYLKSWLLDTWPPATDRWQLLGEVYRMRYRRNEDPTSRFSAIYYN
eukprot:757652_1